jgi:hypothetical protein
MTAVDAGPGLFVCLMRRMERLPCLGPEIVGHLAVSTLVRLLVIFGITIIADLHL